MKLGKFYYLVYIKNIGLIYILNMSYVLLFFYFGNNYKGFLVNVFLIYIMIWYFVVFYWYSIVCNVGLMIFVILLISV